MATRHWIGATAMAVAFAGPALGQDTALICTYAGNEYKVGEYACIAACHGERRLARCDVLSTAATWTPVSDACPSAMIVPQWPSDWSELPPALAMTPIPLDVNMSAIAPAIAPKIAKPRQLELSALLD